MAVGSRGITHRLHGGAGPSATPLLWGVPGARIRPLSCAALLGTGRGTTGFLHSPPHPDNELPHCLWPAPPALCPARRALHPAACIPPCPYPSLPASFPAHIPPCLHPSLPASLPAHIPPCPHPSLPTRWAVVCPALPSPMQTAARALPGSTSLLQRGFISISPGSWEGCRMCWGMDMGCVSTWIRDVSGHGSRMNQAAESSLWGWTEPRSGSSWAGKPALTTATTILPTGWVCGGLGATSGSTLRPPGPPGGCCLAPAPPRRPQPPGGSEPGRGCLGVSKESFQDEAAAGTASAAPGHKGGAAQGHRGFEPRAGILAGAPIPPGDLPAAAAQPLALAQSGTDFAEFAHFWQRQKLENIIGAKGGQRLGGQSLPPPQLSCGLGRAEPSSSSRAPQGHCIGLSCAPGPLN